MLHESDPSFSLCAESKQVKVKNFSNEHEWLTCSASRQPHDPDKLMLTEIIPGNSLWLLERAICMLRPQWVSKPSPTDRADAEGSPASGSGGEGASASGAASNNGCGSGGEGCGSAGQRYTSDSPDALCVLADVATASAVPAEPAGATESPSAGPPTLSPLHLKHYTPRRGLQPPVLGRERPVRPRSLQETRRLYPDVDHSWLCDGRLLRLHKPPPRDASIVSSHLRLFQVRSSCRRCVIVAQNACQLR